MDDKEARHSGHDFNESEMRWAYEDLYRLRQNAITTESVTEYLALNTEATQLERAWLTGPPQWALRWRYLDAAVEDWANDPDYARQILHETFFGSLYNPPNLDGIERDSLLQAARLTRRGSTAEPIDTSSLAYIATYARTGSTTGDLGAHTSWWKAREWIREHAIADADTPVDLTIAAHDVVSGKRRLLNTATAIPAAEAVTELDRLTTVLGGARELDGKVFVDDLHCDVLCDDYQAAMNAANHPDAGTRRIEHKLHADDLRDQTLDFAASIGRQDIVEALADIDRTARQDGTDLAAPSGSWLDQITDHAQRAREQLSWHGIEVHYPHPNDPSLIVHAGRSPVEHLDPWYGEQLRLTQPGGEHTGEMGRIGRYGSCEELLTALENRTATPGFAHDRHRGAVPAEVVTRLREFDQKLRELDTNLTTSTSVRAAIRSGQPIQWTRSGKRSNTTGSTSPGERDPAQRLTESVTSDSQSHSISTDSGRTPPLGHNPTRDAARNRRERIARQPNRTRPHRRHP
ncbi:hypothetical protein NONI108955_21890 [Nocardia ninae]|uniref:Uncharacterized protein n=1 Tax=Nocardia ninae NBRC 108245 TaxID=1210091 RepID=A0A511MTQ2_9NOCA|nr:hypothetical protein [Nocardia ninae]GEM43446.1 hypothetical protein NN4_79650 [Nocardia ninae NBRC 108245]